MKKIICPSCKVSAGFYAKDRVSGIVTCYYKSNGEVTNVYLPTENSKKEIAYCLQCDKNIGKIKELVGVNISK